MSDALVELELKLRSAKNKLSNQEENVLRKCKEKAIKFLMTGGLFASGVTWAGQVCHQFGIQCKSLYTIVYPLGIAAAIISGMWGFDRALNSCLDHILSLEGSRLQRELATILLNKHSNNPWRMRLVNKHYYLEKVFDDSNMELPLSRWRRRSVSGDAWSVQRSNDAKYGDGIMEKFQGSTNTAIPGSNRVEDFLADPLDFVFGHSKRTEDSHPDFEDPPQRRHSRKHRRALRRQKLSTATAMRDNEGTA